MIFCLQNILDDGVILEMMKRNLGMFLFLSSIIFLLPKQSAHADWVDPRATKFQTPYRNFTPTFFPACPRPRGATDAFYLQGTHAIVGDPVIKNGEDIVYALDNKNHVQCYCPSGQSQGIQTNWLATSNLDATTIKELINQGWYYISNGADWGLSPEPYLAQNSDFLCVRDLMNFNGR